MINKYPYTDFNEYNLDWVITHMKDLIEEWAKTKTEWADMQTEFEDLKNYIENLDLQDEVNQKLDEMAADGTLEALILPYLTTIVNPSKVIQIQREGRFLDEFALNTRNAVLLGQDCVYFDGYYYECGNIGNATQAISVWDDSGNLVRYKNDYTELYHASGIAVDANYIYIATMDSDKTLAIIDKSDLSVHNLVTFPDLGGPIDGVTNYNDKIYFINRATIDGVPKFCLNLYDKDGETYEEIAQFNRPENSVIQGGFCMYNDKAYIIMNRANMVYRFPINGTDPDYYYYIPDGDGLYPCGECEGLFVKNDNIYIYSYYYHVNAINSTTYALFSQIFKTDILKPLQKTDVLSYDRFMGRLLFTCDSSEAYSFNPQLTVTTLEELSALANYHKSSRLNIFNTNPGKLYLRDCDCSIVGVSGSRKIDILEMLNCSIDINTMTEIVATYAETSQFSADNAYFSDILDITRSTVVLSNCYVYMNTLNILRSVVRILMPKSIKATVTATITNQAENVMEYRGGYYSGIMKFFECVIGSGSSSSNAVWVDFIGANNYGFQDRLTRANVVDSNAGTTVNHTLVNNSYYSGVKYLDGNVLLTHSGTDSEMTDGYLLDAVIKR